MVFYWQPPGRAAEILTGTREHPMLPVILGLAVAMLVAGCAAAEPAPPPPPEPEPEPEYPEQNFTPAARDYFRRMTGAGYHSRLMDRGYLIGPWSGRYFATRETTKGVGDGFIDGLEVYLAVLDFAEADPSNEFLQSLMQAAIADPVSRIEFSEALAHSPERREVRLGAAESLLSWSLRENGESSYLWIRLGAVQERRGDFEGANESYQNALRFHEGSETYAILRMLTNVQRAMGRSGMARYYEGLARDRAGR